MLTFFPGYKTPIKRYNSYFPEHKLVAEITDTFLVHSFGLIQALILCHDKGIFPKKIIAMDTPNICRCKIEEKLLLLTDEELKKGYKNYLDRNISPEKYNIILFREERKKDYGDEKFYTSIIYYSGDHHPYKVKKIREKILSYNKHG